MALDIGSVDVFVTTSRPATAAKFLVMLICSDLVGAGRQRCEAGAGQADLLLEVALEAQIGIALGEHFLIH